MLNFLIKPLQQGGTYEVRRKRRTCEQLSIVEGKLMEDINKNISSHIKTTPSQKQTLNQEAHKHKQTQTIKLKKH